LTDNSLNNISSAIKDELNTFNGIFKEALSSNIGLVDLVTKYIVKQKGKRIRPALVLLAAKVSGGITERTYRGASLVELLHTATLVHDDVVDNADQRRGFPSINAIWKNKIAVLMGDYLLSRGLMLAVKGNDHDFLEVITNTVRRMSEGELLQIQKTRKLDIDEATYLRIISDKTASLLQTCCAIGAQSASTDPETTKVFSDFGETLGMAFQIKDDILDYDGSFSIFGKPIGADIREKKITLPLIAAINSVEKSEAARIKKLLKSAAKKDVVKEIIEFVHSHGGIVYAEGVALTYAKQAKSLLSKFVDSEAKSALLGLVDFVLARKR
jgi:octaprenyl-diphosphate synthase